MKILFVIHSYPNYVPDLLLHGLRKLLGTDVVDYPRKDCLYQGVLGLGVCAKDQLCPGWFPACEDRLDREDIPQKVVGGYYDFVICDARALQFFYRLLGGLPEKLVVVDGEDRPLHIPPESYLICRRETDGTDFSLPLPMALPEEVMHWIGSYDGISKEYSIGFLGSCSNGRRVEIAEALTKFYPDALFQTSAVPTDQTPSPGGRLSRDEYYLTLQKCRIVLSLVGAGYDTFRFWEHAACNAVHVSDRMPLFIPNDFEEEKQIFRFTKLDELRNVIDRILEKNFDHRHFIDSAREHLTNFHLTTERAKYFLDRVAKAYKLKTKRHL